MEKLANLRFAELVRDLKGPEYLEAVIAFAAAPTIRKVKPANLVRLTSFGMDANRLWHIYGERICRKYGLESFVMREDKEHVLVLFYRTRFLEYCLLKAENKAYLACLGYACSDLLDAKLLQLKARFKSGCPDEVGVFLGIPLCDIIGFIENQGKNCLQCKYWKVYGDVLRANQFFKAYDKARLDVLETLRHEIGASLAG